MKADSKEKNLYWRGAVAYFRKRLKTPDGPKDHWEAIGEIEVDDARRIVREKRKTAEYENYLERWDVRRMRSDVSKLSALFEAYREWAKGARIADRTVRENESCLRRIVRLVGGAAAEEGSMSILDGALVSSYEAARIRAVKEAAVREAWSPERRELELDTAQTTIFSTVRQARSVFQRKCLASAPYRALKLPPKLTAFMKQPLDGTTVKDYTPPTAAVRSAVLSGIAGLRHTQPAMWLAAMLEVNAAARRGTAAEARWDWFVDEGRFCPTTGAKLISLRIGLAKGNRSAPAVYQDLHQEMLAARVGTSEYVIPGETAKERQKVFTDLVAFLRDLGLVSTPGHRIQPNHELRKLYTDEMLSKHGPEAALAATGHSDERMLRPYTQRRGKHALRLA
jgi:hypothetical protein